MIKRFNQWYDGIQEPKRFLLFMGVMTPVCLSMTYKPAAPFALLIMLLMIVMRVRHIHG